MTASPPRPRPASVLALGAAACALLGGCALLPGAGGPASGTAGEGTSASSASSGPARAEGPHIERRPLPGASDAGQGPGASSDSGTDAEEPGLTREDEEYLAALPLGPDAAARSAEELGRALEAAGIGAEDVLDPYDTAMVALADRHMVEDPDADPRCAPAMRARLDHQLTTPVYEHVAFMDEGVVPEDAGPASYEAVAADQASAAELDELERLAAAEHVACPWNEDVTAPPADDVREVTVDGVVLSSVESTAMATDDASVWWTVRLRREGHDLTYVYDGTPGDMGRAEFEQAAGRRLLALADALPEDWPVTRSAPVTA